MSAGRKANIVIDLLPELRLTGRQITAINEAIYTLNEGMGLGAGEEVKLGWRLVQAALSGVLEEHEDEFRM
jgi:hypothetical protein